MKPHYKRICVAVATAAIAPAAVMAAVTMLRDIPAAQPRTPAAAAPMPNRVTTMAFIRPGMTTKAFTAPAR